MKKLITLLLVLTGMVCSVSATSTTVRIYAQNQVSWGSVYIFANYWDTTRDIPADVEILASTLMTNISGTNYYYADITFDNEIVEDAMSDSNYGIKFQFNNGSDWTATNQIKSSSFLSENSIFYIYNNEGNKNSRETFTYHFAKSLANNAITDAVELTPSNNVLTTTVDNEEAITEAWYVLYPSFAESGGYINNWSLTIRPVTFSGNYDITSFINYSNASLQHGNANGVFYVNSVKAKNVFTFDLTNMKFSVSPYFSRTIGADGYATFSSDYDVAVPDGVTAYYATDCTPGKVTMKSISNGIPANTGAFLKGTAGTYQFRPAASTPSTPGTNYLVKGTDAGVAASSGSAYNYVFAKQGEELGFFEVNNAISQDMTGKAYLQYESSIKPNTGAHVAIIFDDEESTGIGATLNDNGEMTNDKPVYNLAGQRVAQPTKGLYIVNGKKVIIK